VLCRAAVAGKMADTSPEWKKPADIMKLRRRRSLRTDLHATRNTTASSIHLSLDACVTEKKGQKRKNPFACLSSSAKTRDHEEDTAAGDGSGAAEAEVNHGEAVIESSHFIDVLVMCLYCDVETVVCMFSVVLSVHRTSLSVDN